MAASIPNVTHAICYEKCGGGLSSLRHVEIPLPTLKKGEVLIKVEASSLNAADWKVQNGEFRPFLPRKFPFYPGTDISGEVVKVGPGVEDFEVGDKVLSLIPFWVGGGLAEFAVGQSKLTIKRPSELSADKVAGLPQAGLTALQALTNGAGLKLGGSNPPTNILITAASSGIGHYAVQLAKLANAHVTATCGARNMELLKSLGAAEVLDYKTPEGASLQSPSGKKYDIVIHVAKGIPWSTFEPELSPKAKVVDLNPRGGAVLLSLRLKFSKRSWIPFMMNAKKKDMEFLVKLVMERKLRTHVDMSCRLTKIEDGWEKAMSGHATGKIIVTST